jgi:hypothetical protein
MNMNMTLDELVNSQIRDYLYREDFIDREDTRKIIGDEIAGNLDYDRISAQVARVLDENENFIYATENYVDEQVQKALTIDNSNYVTEDYVDEEIREQVRCVVDEDGYATEEYVDSVIAEHIRTAIEVQDLIDGRVNVMSADIVRDEITKLRKELYLEGLVPAEKQKPVNQLDQFVSPDGLIAGYPDWDTLTSFVGASLSDPSQKHMVVAMVLATARNIIQEQLNNDHKEIRG